VRTARRRAVYLGSPSECAARPERSPEAGSSLIPRGPHGAGHRIALALPHTASAGGQSSPASLRRLAAPLLADYGSWESSPYPAIVRLHRRRQRGCSQPNRPPAGSAPRRAGWHLIPTYVGSSPDSSFSSCAKLVQPGDRAGQRPRATGPPRPAQRGDGPGSPLLHMESYSRLERHSHARLPRSLDLTSCTRLAKFGIYSSSASGIADLAAQIGSGYASGRSLIPLERNSRDLRQRRHPQRLDGTSGSTSTGQATRTYAADDQHRRLRRAAPRWAALTGR